MALPPQAIERLTQEQTRSPGWSGSLLMFSGFLFLLSLIAWAGILYGYEPYLQGQIKQQEAAQAAKTKKIAETNQSQILFFYSQLTNIKNMLANHSYGTALLDLLEKNTHSNVYYNQMAYSASNQQITLTGIAKSMKDVAEQISIFQNAKRQDQPEFKSVKVGNIGLQLGGTWQFDVNLLISPETLRQPAKNLPALEGSSSSTSPVSAEATAAIATTTLPAATTTASSSGQTNSSTKP